MTQEYQIGLYEKYRKQLKKALADNDMKKRDKIVHNCGVSEYCTEITSQEYDKLLRLAFSRG